MADRYPGYDVLRKRDSVSWNDQTRAVIDQRLAIDAGRHEFFSDPEWQTVHALCDRIIPQPALRSPRVPLAAMLDEKLRTPGGDGYRYAALPPMREAWRQGLAALDAESQVRHAHRFHELLPAEQDAVLTGIQNGEIKSREWDKLPPQAFFAKRILHDIASLYYAHPTSWNEIGFGGPASPRGYVRMYFDRRDPWEASEARPGREARARRENDRVG